MPKYSVIVPVYNTERYLEECVHSLLAQTFPDYEILLVDDCSPDGSPALCDDFAATDRRVRVIHKPVNEGLGFARNTGMAAAMGEYTLFVDSDDTVAPDFLEQCERALLPDTDILVFGMEYRYENKNGRVVCREVGEVPVSVISSETDKPHLFVELCYRKLFPYAPNKAYRTEFLRQNALQFETTKLIEDFLFNIEAFRVAGTLQTTDAVLYYYRKPAHETLASAYCPDFFALATRKYLAEAAFLRACHCTEREPVDVVFENYLNHFLSAVIRNSSKKSGLNAKAQWDEIAKMAADENVVDLLQNYRPRGKKYALICALIRKKAVRRLWGLALGVRFVQQNFRSVFRKLSR